MKREILSKYNFSRISYLWPFSGLRIWDTFSKRKWTFYIFSGYIGILTRNNEFNDTLKLPTQFRNADDFTQILYINSEAIFRLRIRK